MFKEALASLCEAVTDSKRTRLPDQRASDILNILGSFGDREHESVRNERAKVQRSLKPVVENSISRIGSDDIEGYWSEAAEILQNLRDGRGCDIVYAQLLAHVIF